MSATVIVVGGGYGGAPVAKELDDVADVVLVEPRDSFVHNIAALRGLVDPQWTDKVFYPYDGLLHRGRWIRDRAVRVDSDGVTLGSGDRVTGDYIVLATGSTYPYPAKMDVDDSAAAKAKLHETREALRRAGRVLLLGAGPVGLELAGEIKAVWPDKGVTVVEPLDDIVSGKYDDEMRAELRRQLAALDVELVLGTALTEEPPGRPGAAGTFTVTTTSGQKITADVWFRCYGVAPATDYLGPDLAGARQPDGYLKVTPELRIEGHDRVFAVGDVTNLPEPKRGGSAGRHAEVAAANIKALITGGGDLTTYEVPPPLILLPLGPTGGVSQLPGSGVLGPETTSQYKGTDLFAGRYTEMFGLA
ncbi:MAG TPA: FAD-dependent oxidoreductase [Streptosporangiaceae bacterium]|nr:FAD-dependent oxidoreductase [Streptosporangiaceae bacterium]